MKVILKQDIKGVGKKDEIINASDGYARNYLIPKGLAVLADTGNINNLNAKNKAKAAQKSRELENAKKLASELDNKMITINVKAGESGKLFGGVTSKEVSEALKQELNVDVDKKKIVLKDNIKQEGVYNATLKLHEGVSTNIKVHVKGIF